MSIKSVLQSTFSHLYPRASDADDELLLSLAGPAAAAPTLAAGGEAAEPGAEEPGAEESVAEPEPEPDAYDIEIQHIESRLQSQLAHSRRLTEHLLTEARRAREIDASVLQAAEFAHGTVFKKLGLPVHVSNFKVDPVLAKNTGLLHAHELLREVQQTRAEAMCEPDDMDLAARESSVRPLPHYLDPTANQRVRSETSKAKRAALVSSVRGMRELRQTRELFDGTADGASLSQVDPASLAATGQAEATATLIVAERARKPAAGTMSIMQRELEEDVMRRMQAPLNFLRNPRYQRKQFMSAAEAPILPPKHVHTGMSFHCQPQVVLFTDYQIGGCYEIPLELHNVGPLSRRLRILPPASAYFSISLVQYPGDDGFVAPGLHARVLIRFAPDSLGDYDGFILVQTETDSFGVPLKAARQPPSLSLQDVFDAGWCFVGGSKHVSAAGTNEGGDGKFAIVARSDWDADDGIAKRVARETECVANDFVIAPRLLDVPAGASYDLGLTYAPTTVGEHAAEVLLVCDNCHVRPVRVVGQACVVDMLLESVDGSAPPFFSPQTPLSFPETTVGGSRISVVRYSNRTPLPIKFRWNLHKVARELMPPTRMAGDSVLVWDSADCEPPMEHGDGAAGMPFSIEPSSGALPAGTVAEFTVTFAPQLRALHGCYAHLAISGVPDEALPGYGRAKGALAALTDAEVGIQIEGRGTSLPLDVSPRALVVPAAMLIDLDHRFALSVHNPNGAARLLRWRVALCADSLSEQQQGAQGDEGVDLLAADDGASVEVDPPRLLLGPNESATVYLVAKGRRAGRCVRNIECLSEHAAPTSVRLQLNFEGPSVRITQPVVNFGLVALGQTASAELSFDNPTDANARWWLAPIAGGSHEDGAGEFSFSQAMGELEPGAGTKVIVHYMGAQEHELASVLSIDVTRGKAVKVAVRGQVVAHRVSIDEPLLDLGITHVRVPVSRSLTLRNLTLLSTEWNFDGAEGMLKRPASLSFDPPRGILPPGGVQRVKLTLTSIDPGQLEAPVRCSVPRMGVPLGLLLRSEVHGLVVSYTVEPATGEGTPLGRELDDLVGDMHAPPEYVGLPPPPLHFGRSVPCYEERHLLLVVRNHSSVPTRFKIRARDHRAQVERAPALAPPTEGVSTGTLAGVLSRGEALQKGSMRAGRPQLGDAHEPLRRFQSNAGARHVEEQLHATRKRALFGSGDKVVFEVSPSEGILPPWGRVALVVTAHTQMWGVHIDQLLCEMEGLPLTSLHIDLGVVGSPLSLVSNAVGFSMKSVPAELAFAPQSVGHPPMVRRVRVRNDSSFASSVEWSLFHPPLPDRFVSAAVGVSEGRVRLSVGPPTLTPYTQEQRGAQGVVHPDSDDAASDLGSGPPPFGRTRNVHPQSTGAGPGAALRNAHAQPPPFSISPATANVPAHSTVDFTVMYEPRVLGSAAARLVGTCARLETLPGEPSAHPPIALDLSAHARAPRLEMSERRKLKWQVSLLEPTTHADYRRELLLANREDAPVDFTLATSPPFEIVALHVSAGATTSVLLSAQTGEAASNPPRLILPKGESVRVQLQFRPTPATRLGYAAGGGGGGDSPRESVVSVEPDLDEELTELPDHQELHRGALHVSFGNGAQQQLPLYGVVHQAALSLSTKRLTFARKHVSVVQQLPLEVWSPSRAPVRWRLEHILPARTAADELRDRTSTRITGKPPRVPRDEPSIFEFATTSGSFEPAPGVTPKRLQMLVRCAPTEPGFYRSRYRFVVEKGRHAEIDVEVEVTLNEEDDQYHITERAVEDFVFTESLL